MRRRRRGLQDEASDPACKREATLANSTVKRSADSARSRPCAKARIITCYGGFCQPPESCWPAIFVTRGTGQSFLFSLLGIRTWLYEFKPTKPEYEPGSEMPGRLQTNEKPCRRRGRYLDRALVGLPRRTLF
jgi:hypothetical protein